MPDDLKTFQVIAQVEYDTAPVLKVFQVIAQVEYEPTPAGTFNYYGNITVTVTPVSYHTIEFTAVVTAPVTITPTTFYYYQGPGEFYYWGDIPVEVLPQAVGSLEWIYTGNIPCTVTPSSDAFMPIHLYTGSIGIEVTPASLYRVPISGWDKDTGWGMVDISFIVEDPPFWGVAGSVGFTINPAAASIFGAGETVIPVSPVQFVMGGEGIWDHSTPCSDEIVVTGGFEFCGAKITAGVESTVPPVLEIVPDSWMPGFEFGGKGVWGQVTPADIPSGLLTPVVGFILEGSSDLVGVSPTSTVIVPTGGFVLGDRRPDPVEVTYPENYDRVIVSRVAFEMGGGGAPATPYPESTVIASLGGFLALRGAGLCTSKMPPSTIIVTGGSGYILAGATPEEVFEAWALSGMSFEPSIFSGFNFNSFATKGGQAFAAGDAGIYLLGGDHDAGEPINSGIRIGPINAGFDGEKRLRSIQFGSGGNGTSVRVRTDDGGEGVFKPERDSNRVVVSRDLQGREFQIDVMGFEEISQFEMNFLRLARR